MKFLYYYSTYRKSASAPFHLETRKEGHLVLDEKLHKFLCGQSMGEKLEFSSYKIGGHPKPGIRICEICVQKRDELQGPRLSPAKMRDLEKLKRWKTAVKK
jgi:hypothetical protein